MESSAGNTRGLIEARTVGDQPSTRDACLPRGIPAASLKQLREGGFLHCRVRRLPRGIPAASLKLTDRRRQIMHPLGSSAGNTRGLIEASEPDHAPSIPDRLPRGIPAASLKQVARWHCIVNRDAGLPRGIPAASLKHDLLALVSLVLAESSAGNTRGLIEAQGTRGSAICARRLPRGIPAASLKQLHVEELDRNGLRLPRGIPAASLKHRKFSRVVGRHSVGSSAGNTRGLIEAGSASSWHRCRPARLPRGIPAASLKLLRPDLHAAQAGQSSAGNTRGLIEARSPGSPSEVRLPYSPRKTSPYEQTQQSEAALQ